MLTDILSQRVCSRQQVLLPQVPGVGEVCNNQALTLERAVTCCCPSCWAARDQQAKSRAQMDAVFGWDVDSYLGYVGTLSAWLRVQCL